MVMDEHDAVLIVASVSESIVSVSVPIADETLMERLGSNRPIEGSFCPGEVEGDGGEIMVEVVGSDVFVDGVGGDAREGDLNGDEGSFELGKVGLEREMGIIGGEGGLVCDLGSPKVGDLGGQGWDATTETGVESFQEIAGSSGSLIHDVVTEEVEVIVNEEALDRCNKLSEGGVVSGIFDEKAQNSGTETGVGACLVAAGSSSGKAQAITEKVSEEGIERGLAEESFERAIESIDGMDADLLVSQQVGVLIDEAWNPGIEAGAVWSSPMSESLPTQTHIVPEESDVVIKEEGLNCKDEVLVSDGVDVNLPCSEKDQSSSVEMLYAETDDSAVCANAEFWGQQVEVAGGDVGMMNKEETLHSKVKVTATNVFDGNLYCSAEDQQMRIKPAGESSESHGNLCVDSLSSESTKGFAGSEVAVVDDKASSNPSIEAPNVALSGIGGGVVELIMACVDSGSSIEPSQVAADYSVANGSKVSVSDSAAHISGVGEVLKTENRGSFEENIDCVEGQELKVETQGESCRSNIALCTETESSSKQNQVVNGNEVTLMAIKVPNPEVDVPATDTDGMLACSENFQNVKCETSDENAGKDGVVPKDPESSYDQARVVESGEVAEMDIEEVLDWNDEVSRSSALGVNSNSGEDQKLKVEKFDGSSENDMAQGHLESSGELIRIADSGNVASTDNKEVPNFEVEAEMKVGGDVLNFLKHDSLHGNLCLPEDENLKAATLSFCTGKEGVGPAASGILEEQVLVARGGTAVMDDKTISNSKNEILDGDTIFHKVEELKATTVGGSMGTEGVAQENVESSGAQARTEIRVESLVFKCDALDGNISLSEKDEDLKVETAGGSTVDDGVVGKDPSLGADVCDTSILSTYSANFEENKDEKQDAGVQKAESRTHEVDRDQSMKPLIADEISDEGICNMALPNTVAEVTVGSQTALNRASFHGEGDLVPSSTNDFASPLPDRSQSFEVDVVSNEQTTEVEQSRTMQVDLHIEQETVVKEQNTEVEQSRAFAENTSEQMTLKPGSSVTVHQSNYLLPPENDGEFSVSDLVWGKVRSHPWWPGQIFDPADASEKAMKYHKKDCFLVAYFGDRTFAWNDASLLKPFRTNFSQIEKQSNSEAFHYAVSCALEEVSRRVELGLACPCIPKDAFDRIESQIVENTGICQESNRRYGVDKTTGVSSFEPDKLVENIRELAQSPSGGGDGLELVITKAQLLAFCRFKGYCRLPEFQFCGGLLESDADTSRLSEVIDHATPVSMDSEQIFSGGGNLKEENSSSRKRKHNLTDIVYTRKKERSLLQLMGDMTDDEDGSDAKVTSKPVSSSTGKKRKAVVSVTDGSDRRISFYAAKVSTTASPIPKPSFKIGECIRRVASQLTGSLSILRCSSEKCLKVDESGDQPVGFDVSLHTPKNSERGRMVVPTDVFSLDEMLSQLQLAARDPMKGYSFLNTIITFFSSFRHSVALGQYSGRRNSSKGRVSGGRKKKASHANIGSPEEFEFDDTNDSYWTDRIIENYSEEQLLHNGENGEGEYQLVSFEADKPVKSSRRSYSRKRFSSGNHEVEEEEPTEYIDERKQHLSPTGLVLNFTEGDSVPSEMNLNKMFRRFGPLKESETEVDRQTSRARVVFKRGCDAEVAFSSAGKFNIFGSMPVNYELCHLP